MAAVADRLPVAIALAWATFLLAALTELAAVWMLVGDGAAGVLGAADTSEPIIALLISGGGLCLALLAMPRVPVIAWPAAVLAGIAATSLPIRIAGDLLPETGPPDGPLWAFAAVVVGICATATTAVAALYVTRPSGRPTAGLRVAAWALVGGVALVCAARAVLVVQGIRGDDPLTLGGLVTIGVRSWLIVVLALGAVGVIADLRSPVSRARDRIAASDPPPSPAGRVGMVLDELLGRAEGRRLAAEAERRRLAGQLHADAMPALRRAMAGLETGRPADDVARELRAVADDLEGAITERRDPVLEALGLVPALERLAERVEDRGGPTVELRVDEPVGAVEWGTPVVADSSPASTGSSLARPAAIGSPSSETLGGRVGRPPLAIETVALRVATLAVDNAIRHAHPSRIRVAVCSVADHLELTVDDDGPGMPEDAEHAAARAGRHGLVEMRELAAEHHCRISLGRGPEGGTSVHLAWEA